ncbi:hypothetical protein ACU686_04535 [Yinghuangia aomiensis]
MHCKTRCRETGTRHGVGRNVPGHRSLAEHESDRLGGIGENFDGIRQEDAGVRRAAARRLGARRHRGAAFRADVAVEDGRIAAVGALPGAAAATVVDATGRYVAPGFVDAHVRGDAAVLDPAVQWAALRQGRDARSSSARTDCRAPRHTRRAGLRDPLLRRRQRHPPRARAGTGVGRRPAGHLHRHHRAQHRLPGAARHRAAQRAGRDGRAADPADLAAMARLVEQSLDEGACGISTGLEYVPGRYADTAELAALTAVAARRGLPTSRTCAATSPPRPVR